MNEMLQCNAGTDATGTVSLTQRGLDIVHLVKRSDDDQDNGPGNNGFVNIDTEGLDISTINLTRDAIIHT